MRAKFYRLCFLIIICSKLCFSQQTDPLPSWNDTQVKQNIIDYVTDVTIEGSSKFIPVEYRIATFDNDGTLWSEMPLVQGLFMLEKIKTMVSQNPTLADTQPFKAVIEKDKSYFETDAEQKLLELYGLTCGNMIMGEYQTEVSNFFEKAVYPKFNAPIKQITFQPQLELLNYLRSNGFKTFICSGGDMDFMRVISEDYYGIPDNHVIGTSLKSEFIDSSRSIYRESDINNICDHSGKPVNIQNHIGRRPVFASGNVRSGGDIDMLIFSQGNSYPSFQLLINHDDAEREFSYSEKGNESLNASKENNWNVVSMKDDWKVIFPSK